MPTVLHSYIQDWCQAHGWTDLFIEQRQFWAFPPSSYMPLPIPTHAVEKFYAERKPSLQAKMLNFSSIGFALGGLALTAITLSPVPLLGAFGCCAITVALLDEEYV